MNIRLGQTIYIIYDTSISKNTVLMKGKDIFCHDQAFDECFVDAYREPCYPEEEGTRWFRKFSDAKKYILSKYPNTILKKCGEDYWELEDRS